MDIRSKQYNKKLRLINMRDCLKAAKELLATDASDEYREGKQQFICHAVDMSTASDDTRRDTRAYVFKSLGLHYTFQCWMENNNPGRYFSPKRIMTLRRKWIDQLVKALNVEIKKLDGRKHCLPSL